MAIAAADFDFVSELVRAGSGIVLEAGKEYLVDARLSTLAKHEKLDSIATLVAQVRAQPYGRLHTLLIEAMTTNETSFYRDHHPFDALKKVILPSLMASRADSKTLSIWCGACSTGQEPYTIAMTLCETLKLSDWKVTFIATDLSAEMVERSRAAKYNQIEINRGLPATMLVKYFEKHGLEWQIKEPLRKMIDFRILNLTQPWAGLPKVDIVFLRNVLIYFDNETKRQILGKIRGLMKPDSVLFLGCAETTLCLDDSYERTQVEKTTCYRLRPAAAKAA